MEPEEFLTLARSLSSQLDSERSARLAEIVEDRLIWDQMAYRLSRFLKEEIIEIVDEEGKKAVRLLLAAADDWLGTEMDDLIYLPAGEIARDLIKAGFSELGEKLSDDLASASTGGEAVMGLRSNLNKALKQATAMPSYIRSRIQFLLRRLGTLTGGW